MPNISTTYLGIPIKSPLIASSSGLTSTVEDIIEIEKKGAGAVVLKSLFEEEIIIEMERTMNKIHSENYLYPETMEFYENDDVEDTLTSYLKLITDCKKQVKIPIIASINAITPYNWPYFAKSLQQAGADALELNVFVLPSNTENTGIQNEQIAIDIIKNIKQEVTIPVSVKISHYYSNLSHTIKKLSESGVDGIVLFNRFYSPDIDIDDLEVISTHVFSNASDYVLPLNWIGLTYGRVTCDLSASTGIHDSQTMIKMLLAGAKTTQVASTLYKNGFNQIEIMIRELKEWMKEKGFESLDDFRGKLSMANATNPAGYLRLQFMKHFANK
jgi:dihydroorotate dehydrogenase (fumarate)